MTKQNTISAVASMLVAVVGIVTAQDAAAQGPIFTQNSRVVSHGYHHGGHHIVRPMLHHHRVSHPVYVTPQRFNGYTPWGGINTGNHQVNNTFFDYGRNGSQYNGSSRWVNRPVYDTYGRVTGYQQGHVWNNSHTGQEHGNVTTVTPNGLGGQNETITQYSTAGGNIRPKNAGK